MWFFVDFIRARPTERRLYHSLTKHIIIIARPSVYSRYFFYTLSLTVYLNYLEKKPYYIYRLVLLAQLL